LANSCVFFGLLDRSCQRQQQRLEQVALASEQVGTVGYFQAVGGTAQQTTRQVTVQQDNRDEQVAHAFAKRPGPGVGSAAVAIALDQDEVGERLDGHQAGVLAVKVLVGGYGDVLGCHLFGQQGALLVALGPQVRFEVFSERLEGATGRGDEAVELSQFEERADEADATRTSLVEGDEGSQDDTTEAGRASGGVEESGHRVGVGRSVTAQPVTERGARDVMVLGILPLGRVVRIGKVVEGLGGVGARPTERVCA
jgi:hypothetical protein